jgi:hypothetical protein
MSLADQYNEDNRGTLGFFARNNQVPVEWKTLREGMYNNMIRKETDKIIILRLLMFFAEAQNDITLGKLREFFTDKTIALYEQYGYIKFA